MTDDRITEAEKALARYEDRNSKPNPAHLADAVRGLLAVLREAHAPTDDEREALTLIVRDVHNYDERPGFLSLSGVDAGRIADAILAAGFHRSVASESSVETWVCGRCGGAAYEHSLATSTCIWEPVETRPEPQGEPSHAQVLAALRVFFDGNTDFMADAANVEDMRAALRAAGGVR